MLARYDEYNQRMSAINKKYNLGYHYWLDKKIIMDDFNNKISKSIDITKLINEKDFGDNTNEES